MNPMSPMSPAEAPRRAHLYVGNLSPRVTEYMLTEIFAVAGPVQHVKIIPDRNYQHGGLNYGFVEYMDMRAAETALQTLNGRKIFDTEIRVNWAYQGQQNKEDTSGHFHVFVGDLSPEVNDDVLAKAFSAFGTLSDARVMWDMNSGKSRGYGFLAFRDKTDAEQAIATMNGEWLGSRAIRVNWANQKTQGAPAAASPSIGRIGGGGGMGGGAPAPINFQGGPLSYEGVVQQTPQYNTTVYVGNLLDTHEHAAMAIVQLQGQMCSWGKDRADGGAALSTPAATPYGNMPMYGMPQPNTYGQYGFGAYGGFPNQAGATGTPGAAASSMGSPAQWGGADPNSYYSNYWGGYYGQQAQGDPQHQGA
ncbi:uncharacterized protein B0H18DRAFT_971011 [Fomitopsis serialis]|uniref:uncharacterized protein n=1 Tax=Fomitopsis serialis TaxID=139415 RepID=UPI0020083351|nr:uncharacterized protein B0H18DRAFT_971011 [Neoantrodia serialis]KAH9937512.1 hypothetical protein B0H18DRAFT_971011 [Neoantrodia serialis]